jgi:hypothetical protein
MALPEDFDTENLCFTLPHRLFPFNSQRLCQEASTHDWFGSVVGLSCTAWCYVAARYEHAAITSDVLNSLNKPRTARQVETLIILALGREIARILEFVKK